MTHLGTKTMQNINYTPQNYYPQMDINPNLLIICAVKYF